LVKKGVQTGVETEVSSGIGIGGLFMAGVYTAGAAAILYGATVAADKMDKAEWEKRKKDSYYGYDNTTGFPANSKWVDANKKFMLSAGITPPAFVSRTDDGKPMILPSWVKTEAQKQQDSKETADNLTDAKKPGQFNINIAILDSKGAVLGTKQMSNETQDSITVFASGNNAWFG